jgi:hypothetical protein
VEIELDGDDLTISLPAQEGVADPTAMAAARSVISQLAELDTQASAYLFALPQWRYGDDAGLWLLLVQSDNVRFCYAQSSVNDEQVVGFTRRGDAWILQGRDPRFRGEGDNPYIS